MRLLPVKKVADLADADDTSQAWLVEGIWGAAAVGILGGEPKCCKTIASQELAVATASGRPFLGRFTVHEPGRVLIYAAEDAAWMVKQRLTAIAKVRGVDIADLDIQLITSERLRLDDDGDLEALDATVAALKPRLLILDPFVRLHRIDENSSAEVARVLDGLRLMQRRHGAAILVVHHAKKNGGNARAGQALRGSSEFHAWGDSMLCMRRRGDELTLSVEQRAAASIVAIPLALVADGDEMSLEIQMPEQPVLPAPKPTPAERIERALATGESMNLNALRDACGVRTATLCETLRELVAVGRVERDESGYSLADH
jgi:RecA-family ATPase